jgi:hypothetical protein
VDGVIHLLGNISAQVAQNLIVIVNKMSGKIEWLEV